MSENDGPKTAVNPDLAQQADLDAPAVQADLDAPAVPADAEVPAEPAGDETPAGTAMTARAPEAEAPPAGQTRYTIPPISMGFSENELVRVGRAAATAPAGALGLLIVRRSPQPVRLGQIVPLRQPRHVLGRGRGVSCFLDDDLVAEYAAVVVHELTFTGSSYVLHTPAPGCALINGAPAHRVTPLASGDLITIGRNELVFFQVTFEEPR